jgi:Spy/CpxP family protein refolding chaperone
VRWLIVLASCAAAFAQGRGGRGLAGATPEQTAAIARLNAELAPETGRLAAARQEVIAASLSGAPVAAKIEAVRAAEIAVAEARADAVARLQASPAHLTPAQLAALPQALAGGRGSGARVYRTSMPHVTGAQARALLDLTAALQPQIQALNTARAGVVAASAAVPRDDSAIRRAADAVAAAELALAEARAASLAPMQSGADRLDTEQLSWLAAAGGIYGNGFTEPEPMDFNDHRGYVSLFDGVSLQGWDGNPKFWRVENGAIVGESTPENPSGNTYIAYRGVVAKDFTLKFEIKVEGSGGSGLQYRSKTGLPWLRPIPANVTANVGPLNLAWMMTGPQADFWPSQIYTGQFYSENTPMGIMAFRGQVVEGAGLGAKRLMGVIGDRTALGNLVKQNDWNQYTVIARGGTFLHIVNGQLMAVMVDDDPESSNNQPGIFGIEIEATTKVSVRNIWLKKLN